jgi:hypothetical protein
MLELQISKVYFSENYKDYFLLICIFRNSEYKIQLKSHVWQEAHAKHLCSLKYMQIYFNIFFTELQETNSQNMLPTAYLQKMH